MLRGLRQIDGVGVGRAAGGGLQACGGFLSSAVSENAGLPVGDLS